VARRPEIEGYDARRFSFVLISTFVASDGFYEGRGGFAGEDVAGSEGSQESQTRVMGACFCEI
jgi:hypothetical protein